MKKITSQTTQNTTRITPPTTEESAAASSSPRAGRVKRLSSSDNQQLSDFVEAHTPDGKAFQLLLPPTDYDTGDSASQIDTPTQTEQTKGASSSSTKKDIFSDDMDKAFSFVKENPPTDTKSKGLTHEAGKQLETAGKQLENNEGTKEEQATAAKDALATLQEHMENTGSSKPPSKEHLDKLKLLEERIDDLDDLKKLGTCLLNIGLILLQQAPIPLDQRGALEAKERLNELEDETPVEDTKETEEADAPEEVEDTQEAEKAQETDDVDDAQEAEKAQETDDVDDVQETDEVDSSDTVDNVEDIDEPDSEEEEDDITITVEQNNNGWDDLDYPSTNTNNQTTGGGDGLDGLDGLDGAGSGIGDIPVETTDSADSGNIGDIPVETTDSAGSGNDLSSSDVGTITGTVTGEGEGSLNEGGNTNALVPPKDIPPPPAPPKKWKLTPMDSAGIARTRQIGPNVPKRINFGVPLSQQAEVLKSIPGALLKTRYTSDPKGGVTRSASMLSKTPSMHTRTNFMVDPMKQPAPPETGLHETTTVSGVVRSHTVKPGDSSVVTSTATTPIPEMVLQENSAGLTTVGQIVNDQRKPLSSTAVLTDVVVETKTE